MAKPTKRQQAMIDRGIPLTVALVFPSNAALEAHIERRLREALNARVREVLLAYQYLWHRT